MSSRCEELDSGSACQAHDLNSALPRIEEKRSELLEIWAQPSTHSGTLASTFPSPGLSFFCKMGLITHPGPH